MFILKKKYGDIAGRVGHTFGWVTGLGDLVWCLY